MKDTKDIIHLNDGNTKHLSLFRHVLPTVLAGIVLFGITIYGLFSLPDIEIVQDFFQSVDDFFTPPIRQVYAILILGIILVAMYFIRKYKRAE